MPVRCRWHSDSFIKKAISGVSARVRIPAPSFTPTINSAPLQPANHARHLGGNHIDRRPIGAMRQDDVGVALGWFDELFVHRAYGFQVLLDDAFYRAAAFGDIPLHAADETHVGGGVDKDLQRHHVAQVFVIQGKQAFDHDYRCWFDGNRPAGAIVEGEVVLRHLDRYAIAQGLDVLYQQWPLESLRMVVILLAAHFWAEMGLVAVIVILHHDRDHISAKGSQYLLGHG